MIQGTEPRIIWMVETYHPVLGGGEKYTRSLVLRLVAQGFRVDVITRRSSEDLLPFEVDEGVTIHRVGSPGTGRGKKFTMLWGAFVVARRLIGESDVLMNGGTRVLALAARLAVVGTPCALVLRPELNGELDGSLALWGRKNMEQGRRLAFLLARLRNLLLGRAGAVVAISEAIAREAVRAGFNARRIHLIPHGIDLSEYAPVSHRERMACRKTLGLKTGEILVTYTGRLIEGKGLETLFEALLSLADLPEWHLVLVGSGSGQVLSIEEKLRQRAGTGALAGRVTFTGRVDDVAAYLQASDVFVFPTFDEALGMSAAEAQACGLPAVASRTGGVPDIVEDGVTGVLVPPGESGPLAEALRRLVADSELRRKFALAARTRVEQRFAMPLAVARYVELFRSLTVSTKDLGAVVPIARGVSMSLIRRVSPILVVAALLASAGLWVHQSGGAGARSVVFDLADRLPFAARGSARETVIFGWPDAEPHLINGFGGDSGSRGREPFLWVRQGATLKVDIKEPRDRGLIFDIEAYPGIEDQRLSITVNGRALGVRQIPSNRSRVRFDWPGVAQRESNEIVLDFTRALVPAREPGGSEDTRDFAAALFSLVVGDSADGTLDFLRERETPRAWEISERSGIPSFVLPGSSQTSFAFRLPKRATLEFESALHSWSVAAGGKGSLEIVFDSTDGRRRDRVTIPLGAQSPQTSRIDLQGEPGTPFILRMDLVSANPGVTFARIGAPRVFGYVQAEPPVDVPPGNASRLGQSLRGSNPNVLLIVLDAARAQSFGAYGHFRDTTPNIDRFARESFTFDNAYTTAAYTLAAMSSVWTSQQPDRHRGEVAFSAKLPKDRLMLAEVLTAQGIHTAGFVANQVAGAFNGFDRGFKEFEEPWRKYGSQATGFRKVIPDFLDRIKEEGARFFAYVHYREPHHPYDPPPPHDTRFGFDAPIPKERREGGAVADQWLKSVNQGVIKATTAEIDHLRRLYDGNLSFADQEVGYLRGQMEARGLLENTVVILMGDHGEALFEHGYIGHNAQVFEETARVPLIVALPRAMRAEHPPARVSTLVDLTDIAPTILDVFGLSGAGGSGRAFQGRSLLEQIDDRKRAPVTDARSVLTRTVWDRPVYAMRDSSYTFIYNTVTTDQSLFDRSSIPRLEGKEQDLAPRAPIPLIETYRQSLLAWVASLKRPSVAGDRTDGLSREQCEELKALGYVSATFACPSR